MGIKTYTCKKMFTGFNSHSQPEKLGKIFTLSKLVYFSDKTTLVTNQNLSHPVVTHVPSSNAMGCSL